MPQVDVEWPSEDEDFDAKVDTNSTAKAAVKSKPSLTKDLKPDSEPEEPAEAAAPEPAQEQPAEEESAPALADDSSNQPDPDPVVEHEAAQLASEVDNDPGAVSEIPVAPKSKSPKLPKANMSMLRVAGEVVLVLLVVGLGLWAWKLNSDRNTLQSQVNSLNSNPQSIVQKQTQQLITRVGHLMQLPTGETPTVAEVSNASQARQQSSFFNNAQNGDRVLMYVKAGEAILYRPSTNKIILVAPLVFNNTSGTSSTNKSTSNSSATSKSSGTTPTNTGTTSGH